MITFSKLGNKGRQGNAMFEIAFIYSLALKHDLEYALPEWEHQPYFFHQLPRLKAEPVISIAEPAYAYQSNIFEDHVDLMRDHVVDIEGYFQHEEYWPDKNAVKELFKLKEEFVGDVYEKYRYLLYNQPSVAIGVRRGDYVNNKNYHNLSQGYYINSLETLDAIGEKNLIFMSDDPEWCKFHFSSLPKSFFPTFDSDIEAFCFGTLLGSQEDAWIIANSTFHWWMAYLAQPGCGVIQPTKLFAGDLLKKHGDHNFYRAEWESVDDTKIDLKDMTFTIPVKYDHPDRKWNLELTLYFLQKYFDTNVVVMEQGGHEFEYVTKWNVEYRTFEGDVFHRTRMLNLMAQQADTAFIANWDADVMVPPVQIYESVRRLRGPQKDSKPCSVIYPYDNLFFRIPKQYRKQIYPSYDLISFKDLPVKKQDKKSVGGAVMYNREAFLKAGGENEKFVSYSKEDQERYVRFEKLGLKIDRTPGNLYHFDHWIGPDSSTSNPFYKDGVAEFERISGLSKAELEKDIEGWYTKTCPTCDGYGEIKPDVQCKKCEGTGRVEC